MVTASLAALQLRVRHPALVAGSALVGLAVHGSLVFWSFYFLNGDGTTIAAALVFLELGGVAALVVWRGFGALRPLAELAAPATATLVFVFVLSFRVPAWKCRGAGQGGQFRFLPGLPIDNAVRSSSRRLSIRVRALGGPAVPQLVALGPSAAAVGDPSRGDLSLRPRATRPRVHRRRCAAPESVGVRALGVLRRGPHGAPTRCDDDRCDPAVGIHRPERLRLAEALSALRIC